MKRRRDEENGKLDAVEIKKLKKKHKKSGHHNKNEVPVCLEETFEPLDLKECTRDVSTSFTKHEKIGKTKKKHTIVEKNIPENDADAYLFTEELKKHAASNVGFSETKKEDTVIKKKKKKHTTPRNDSPDKNESRDSDVLAGSDLGMSISGSDSIGIKKKKKHKHDKKSRIFEENIQSNCSDASDIKQAKKNKKKKKDKNKQVDDHIPVRQESTDDREPDSEITENNISLEENCQTNGDEKCSKKSKKKKKMKSKGKSLKGKSDSDSHNNALDYLRQWQSDGENWKFQKVRQVWLLHNMYNKDKIGQEDFDILLRYLEPLRGRAREKTLSEAEDIMKSLESKEEADMDDEKLLKVQRARQVIQILSIEPGD